MFEILQTPSRDVKWVVRFVGLEFRAEAWPGGKHFGEHQMQFNERVLVESP